MPSEVTAASSVGNGSQVPVLGDEFAIGGCHATGNLSWLINDWLWDVPLGFVIAFPMMIFLAIEFLGVALMVIAIIPLTIAGLFGD